MEYLLDIVFWGFVGVGIVGFVCYMIILLTKNCTDEEDCEGGKKVPWWWRWRTKGWFWW